MIEEAGFPCAWEAELNPFRSLRPWGRGECFNRHEAIEGWEGMSENAWWLCLGRTESNRSLLAETVSGFAI